MFTFFGEIVSVSEKESPGEGLKTWEVVWSVPDFIKLVGRGKWRSSPGFHWIGKDGGKTVSELWVIVWQVGGVDWLKVRHATLNTMTKTSVCLLGRDQAEHYTMSEQEFYEAWRYWNFLPWSTFVEQQDNLLAPDGSLTVILRFQALVGELGPRTPAIYGGQFVFDNLFLPFYTSGDGSDVKILVSEQVFPAHRFILTLRSPVFAAMLDSGMVEANTGEILIPDSSPGTVDVFLRYLYADTISFTDNIPEVLNLADKYQVENLKKICTKALTYTLTVSNSVDYLELADLYYLTDLRKRIVRLFKENIEILHSEQWEDLTASNSALTSEILMELKNVNI